MSNLIKIEDAVRTVLEHPIPLKDGLAEKLALLPSYDNWIPISERLPSNGEIYLSKQFLVTRETEDGLSVDLSYFEPKHGFLLGPVIAWMPLPEPFSGKESCNIQSRSDDVSDIESFINTAKKSDIKKVAKYIRQLKAIVIALVFTAVTTLCVGFFSPSFAGEYQTGIDAFQYGSYTIPAYDGDASEDVNSGLPVFSSDELSADPFVYYGNLDSLGRCTPAQSMLSQSLMPTGKRGSISSVYPTGWVQQKYDVVSGGYLYNRCHLIGWQLAGADLNNLTKDELAKDLITGTRFLNVGDGSTGMVGYENEVASYLKEDPENEVAYRVTPVFQGNNLVASGVLMEGQSVASNDVEFCAFCYNVQPEIAIDYETGKSKLAAVVEDNKNISDCVINIGGNAIYTGIPVLPAISIRDGSTVLNEGTDYMVSAKGNVLPGKVYVSISGVGSYKGSVSYSFIIVPGKASIAKLQPKKDGANKAAVRIEAKKQEGVSGYQYSYRLPGKKWSSVKYRGNVRIVKGLKKGKTYQIRIRSYKTVDGKNYYGKWCAVKKVRTK